RQCRSAASEFRPLKKNSRRPPGTPVEPTQVLRHTVVEKPARSVFLRDGPVAAQFLSTDGTAPRLLVAFAAGNSGAAIWFEPGLQAVSWQVLDEPDAVQELDAQGRCLRGIQTRIAADCSRLVVRQALLGSVRVLRDHQFDGRLPPYGVVPPLAGADSVRWQRDRLDGAAGYLVSLQVIGGSVQRVDGDRVALIAASAGEPLQLALRVLTGDEPLLPLDADELLNGDEADLPSARRTLLFLSYREKLLAGSWRFHTYFGRDTLMTLRLLMPVLRPAAIEAALASVLLRLNQAGEVAHEEDVGEFAALTRLLHGEPASVQPIFDYKMVDDDFMLLPVAAAYLLHVAATREHAARFLARREGERPSFGALLVRNMAWVLGKARPFAQRPQAAALVRLKPGEIVGDWRDSGDGLGGGVYSYSVNAVLVPAALRAIGALAASGVLQPYIDAEPLPEADQALALAKVWETHAPPLFDVRVGAAQATLAVRRHAADLGVPIDAAAASLPGEDLVFSALSLDDAGCPIPVMHSDFSFALLLSDPTAEVLDRELAILMRPFPAGLMTDVGLLVANAAYGNEHLRSIFGPNHYHGEVVWSWQQAMVAAGLERQLAREDLRGSTRSALLQAQATLWHAIIDTREVADGELWTWAIRNGHYEVRPFGPISATADESNAAQLWSTVYLAVKPPPAIAPGQGE
ncbi:MAG TPA: hypothetical protein VJ598_13980, partial [Albitalea sp.]|nr:hypothetical protein [Albitalea sp.]